MKVLLILGAVGLGAAGVWFLLKPRTPFKVGDQVVLRLNLSRSGIVLALLKQPDGSWFVTVRFNDGLISDIPADSLMGA